MDSNFFLYLPRWVKIISISVLVFSLILGVVIAVYFAARQDKSDYVLIGMSLAQTSASGLLLALVVFFSEKDNSIKLLIKKTKHFLKKEIPHGLQRIVPRIANKQIKRCVQPDSGWCVQPDRMHHARNLYFFRSIHQRHAQRHRNTGTARVAL